MQRLNYYKILGVKPSVDSQILRETINLKLRKVQAQINNPDKDIREIGERKLKKLIEARKILLDSDKREEYDNKLKKSLEVELKTLTDNQGKEITFDHLERPIKIVYSTGRTISYVYDEAENILTIADSELDTIDFQYDLLDRLVKVMYPGGHVFSYTYDAAGNREKVAYPNGEVTYYTHNPNNWLTEVSTVNKKTRYEYDKLENPVRKILPNGIIVSYRYGAGAKLSNLKITNRDNSVLYNFSYDYDAVGNCLAIKRSSKNSNQRTSFIYDPLYRLIETNYYNGERVKYKYDKIGNRLSAKAYAPSGSNFLLRHLKKPLIYLSVFGKKTAYKYDDGGRLIQAGNIQFTFDDDGNLIKKKRRNETTHYSFDDDGRLAKIEYPDGTRSEYTYDILGRRVAKKDKDGRTKRYLYDGYNLCQELDDGGRVIASYMYDHGIDHPISMTRNGETYYYLYDHLGSVIALTDKRGTIVTEYEYDAWGNIIKKVGEIENPFRYTAREWDEENSLYYYRTRYYDSTLGRFISKDPIQVSTTNTQMLNKYSYCLNNPQTFIDPLGLFPIWQDYLPDYSLEVLIGLLEALRNPLHKYAGGASELAELTDLIPHYFNPDYLAGFKSTVHTGMSLIGGIYGGSLGSAAAVSIGLKLGLAGVGGATIAGTTVFIPAIAIIGAGALIGSTMGSTLFNQVGRFITNTAQTGGGNLLNVFQNTFDAIQSNVGGVLFDKSADILTDLEKITGAYWDATLGQIVLVGKRNGKLEELFLPKMDEDHLAVAIRALYAGDNLGVSIDPPPSYLESGNFPPDGTEMLVRYLGNTKDTLFGAIMFEADKLLKNLSMGIDNEKKEEITSNVPHFQNELDLSLQQGTQKKNTWHRMWFVIEDMKLEMPVKETSDRDALIFGKASIKVKAEYLSQEKNPGADPTAERFSKYFTLHFDELAKEFPILERLRELAKISAVVKWLKKSGKSLDLSFLNEYEFIKVPTPEQTPGITASKSRSWQNGNTTHTQTYSLYGGVDFDFQFQTMEDDGEALSLKRASQESKPCETALRWEFGANGKIQKALAMRLSKTTDNFTITHSDFSLPSRGGTDLELARYYDSLNSKPSIFGYGWTLNIPYELFVLNPLKSASPLLITEKVGGKSHKFIFVEDSQAYYWVREEREEQGQTLFSYDPQNFIKKNSNGSFVWQMQDGVSYNFNSEGKLVSKTNIDNRKIDYIYEENKLVKILDSKGGSFSLIYDDKSRVKQVIAPSQTKIDYFYNCHGDLLRVSDNKGNIKNYVYGAEHRLIKYQDEVGRTVFRNSYDPFGRIINKKSDKIILDGKEIIRKYNNNYQLVKEEDQEGNVVTYEYDEDKNLMRSVISDSKDRKVTLDHDTKERIKSITNPMGNSLKLSYGSKGNITSVTNPSGHSEHLKYDSNNNPVAFKDTMGNEWKQEFDHCSCLKGFIDPLGNKVEFTYTKDKLIESIRTPNGFTRYKYDNMNRLIKITDPNRNSTEFSYDSKGKLIIIKDALGGKFKYQ